MNDGRQTTNDKRRLSPRWLLIVLPLAVLIFFLPVLIGRRFFFEDIVQQFYPSLSYLANSLHHFRLPYWSPYVFSGVPFINDIQSQVFYPPNWLFSLFIQPDGRLCFWSLELVIILHVLTAGLLMYALARELKLSRPAALFAGLSFMLSGFVILRTIHLGVVYTYTWFPLLFLLYHRTLHERKLHLAFLAGLVCALSALGGYPQTLLHMAYALTLYGIYFVVTHWRARGPETLGFTIGALAIIGLVGVGIAAAQYLPSFEYVKYTVRSSLNYQDLVDASLRPVQLLTLAVPKYFGSISGNPAGQTDTVQFWGGAMEYHYWETVIYLGILPLILALFGMTDRRQPLRWYFIILAIIALLLALGKYTPLYSLGLAVLPGFKRFRIPGRFSDLFTFGMTLLAGFGLEQFLRRDVSRLLRKLLTATVAVAISVFVIWAPLFSGALRGLLQISDAAIYANIVKQWSLFLVLILLALGVVFYRRMKSYRASVVLALILGITFVDLYLFGAPFNSSSDSPTEQVYPPVPELVKEQRASLLTPFRINSRIPKVGMLLGRDQGNLDQVELLEGYTPLGIARYAPFVEPAPWVLDLLNAKYRCKIDTASRRLVFIPSATYLPRARMVYQYRVVTDSQALQIVKAGDFDYRNAAILEQTPGFVTRADTPQPGAVSFTMREPSRMQLDVTTGDTGILVLSEVYYPEWKATLDGKPLAIYPADFFLRGVTIPPGNHKLDMYFDGSHVRSGILISVLTLVITLVAMLVLRSSEARSMKAEGKMVDNVSGSSRLTS